MRQVIGCDTETVDGNPYTIQCFPSVESLGTGQHTGYLQFTNRQRVFNDFMSYISGYPSGSVFYFHNLEFDIQVIFCAFQEAFVNSDFTLEGPNFNARVLFGKVNHVWLTVYGRRYELSDTFAFFKTSLENLLLTFKVPVQKMKRPRKIGQVKYEGEELEYFKRYAMIDAEGVYYIGQEIEQFHQRYDIKPCISAPQMTLSIFRHHFVSQGGKDCSIPFPESDVVEPAKCSYHGGKNGLYKPAGVYENARIYDINSAYPFAMAKLPNFLDCTYRRVSDWESNREGIYCISGSIIPSPYLLLQDHNGKSVIGDFQRVWTTSYELRTLYNRNQVQGLEIHSGYLVSPNPKQRVNPLSDFANHFFKLKQQENGVLREFYKILLNSLYGKFGESRKSNDVFGIENAEQIAGAAFNPMLASMITGFVRAYLTELEYKYAAIHSSTDGFITQRRVTTNKMLGGLSQKAEGTAVILRPKMYLLYNSKREIEAYAVHGYHGSFSNFVRMLRSGKRIYFHQRMWKYRESLRRKEKPKPLTMGKFYKRINLSIQQPLPIPKLHWQGKEI